MTVKLVWRRDRFLRGSDQIPFLQQRWAGVRFTARGFVMPEVVREISEAAERGRRS